MSLLLKVVSYHTKCKTENPIHRNATPASPSIVAVVIGIKPRLTSYIDQLT